MKKNEKYFVKKSLLFTTKKSLFENELDPTNHAYKEEA